MNNIGVLFVHGIVKVTLHLESVCVLMSILITGCPVAGTAEISGNNCNIDHSVHDCASVFAQLYQPMVVCHYGIHVANKQESWPNR